jgi:hypothetical protein
MQVSINNSHVKQLTFALLASLCYLMISAKSAMSSDDSNQVHTTGAAYLIQEPHNCQNEKSQNPINTIKPTGSEIIDVNSSASPTPKDTHYKPDSAIPVDSDIVTHRHPEETGIHNLLNFPNCGGICLYGDIKLVNESDFEATIGVIWQFKSPEQTNTKIQSRLVDAQISKSEDEQNFIWMDRLLTAVRTGDFPGARGFAILLAPKLGKTPENLLDEIRGYHN